MPRGEPALLGADYATLRSLRFVFLCLPRMPTVCKLASGCVTFPLRYHSGGIEAGLLYSAAAMS